MVDPLYALIFVGPAVALLVATLMPAPESPAEDDAEVGLALLAAGCVAALVMGVLALLGLPVATAAVGAVAWLLVMPCIWLARAPQPLGDDPYDEGDDDGNGSPPPRTPCTPPAPDDRLPGRQPATAAPARPAWTSAPQPAPVLATAARTQRLLVAREAERMRAAQEVERLLAAAAGIPLPQASPAPAPLHDHALPRLAPFPPPRPRADDRAAVHAVAAAAHPRTRRRRALAAGPAIAKHRAQAAPLRD